MFLVAWLEQGVYSGLYNLVLIISKGVFMKQLMQKTTQFSKFLGLACAAVLIIGYAGCSKQRTKEDMTLPELAQKTTAFLEKKKYDDAISHLETLIARFPDNPNVGMYKMLLAELYFKREEYPSAHELYEHYNQFYPSDKSAEYAKYKSLLAMFYQTLRAECDQTETEEAVRLCDEYLQNKQYDQYRKDVLDIKKTCTDKLIDKEVYVFNFYLKQDQFDAAHNRIKSLRDKYLAANKTLEPRLLYLETKLAQREKNKKVLHERLDLLMQKYPESQFTQMAQGLTAQPTFIF